MPFVCSSPLLQCSDYSSSRSQGGDRASTCFSPEVKAPHRANMAASLVRFVRGGLGRSLNSKSIENSCVLRQAAYSHFPLKTIHLCALRKTTKCYIDR